MVHGHEILDKVVSNCGNQLNNQWRQFDHASRIHHITIMAIYALLAPPESPQIAQLRAAIAAKFADKFLEFASGQFFISSALTTAQVSKTLELSSGRLGRALIILVGNYTGWHNKDIWEWLTAQSSPEGPFGVSPNG